MAEHTSTGDASTQPLTPNTLTQPYTAVNPMTEEHEPFLTSSSSSSSLITRSLKAKLYTSHFLSTFNSRLFEFGAVLFLAAIYPSTLLPLSIYALVRSAAAILFAQYVGKWIDTGERLGVVRWSIVMQRVAVAGSCVLLLWMAVGRPDDGRESVSVVSDGMFWVVVGLACVEKAGAMMNLIAVERDWVIVIAGDDDTVRQELNAEMRRIDLICKLFGPLAISAVDVASTTIAIGVVLALNLIAVPVEYICIAKVYSEVPALHHHTTHDPPPPSQQRQCTSFQLLTQYFKHTAFLPSFSLALLYLTVLSFSGQMVTFLKSTGYTSLWIGITRTAATVLEVSATWLAPRLMNKLGAIRGGLWSLSWLSLWLLIGGGYFVKDTFQDSPNPSLAALVLVIAVAFSRLGLWGYDLCAQLIIQEEVEAGHRGSFSTVEAAWQNFFEMMSFAVTIVFPRVEEFRWSVVVSMGAVYTACGLYALFVRRRRGHLFHAPPCLDCKM